MTPDRKRFLTLLPCLWLAGCAGSLEPQPHYKPPRGAAPMEKKALDTDELEARTGQKGNRVGAEVVNTETLGDLQSIEVRVPVPPDEVDSVRILLPGDDPSGMTREAQIIHNYETNDVGIKFQVPKSDKLRFQLRLIDHPDDDWPPVRQQ